MTEQELLEALRTEMEAETPDLLGQLLAECGFYKDADDAGKPVGEMSDIGMPSAGMPGGRIPAETMPSERMRADRMPTDRMPAENKERKRRVYYFALAAAAVILFFFAAVRWGGGLIRPEQGAVESIPVARVWIDVNPSVELVIDESARVFSCAAVNGDAENVLDGLDLTGMDVAVSAQKVVDTMMGHGYLTESANSILLSVSADEVGKGQQLTEKLSLYLSEFLGRSGFEAAIVGQNLPSDTEMEDYAKRNGISVGKAWIVKKLLSARNTLKEEELLELTTQELLLLLTEPETAPSGEKPAPEDYTIYGKVSTGDYIAPEEAVNIALSHTEHTKSEMIGCEFDCYRGLIVYEVEFIADGVEYEVKVHGQTGEVLEVEAEPDEDFDRDDEEEEDHHDDGEDWDDDDSEDRDDDDDDRDDD